MAKKMILKMFSLGSHKKSLFSVMEKKIRNLIFLEDVFPPPVLKSNTQERELFTSYQENGSPENPFDPFSKSDLK